MAKREMLLTLDEVLQHVLEPEDEYNEPGSDDESSEEEYERCERVPILSVDEENIETVRYYEAVVSNAFAFLLVVMYLFIADLLKVFTLPKEFGR